MIGDIDAPIWIPIWTIDMEITEYYLVDSDLDIAADTGALCRSRLPFGLTECLPEGLAECLAEDPILSFKRSSNFPGSD